jgi:hypothetical protein
VLLSASVSNSAKLAIRNLFILLSFLWWLPLPHAEKRDVDRLEGVSPAPEEPLGATSVLLAPALVGVDRQPIRSICLLLIFSFVVHLVEDRHVLEQEQ